MADVWVLKEKRFARSGDRSEEGFAQSSQRRREAKGRRGSMRVVRKRALGLWTSNLNTGLRVDVIVDDRVFIELRSVEGFLSMRYRSAFPYSAPLRALRELLISESMLRT